MSREHVFSRNAFLNDRILVSGHPSGRSELGLDDLVTKCLCRKHNSALSDLDQALGDLINVCREANRLRSVRAGLPGKRLRRETFTLDGLKTERALVKTVLNCAALKAANLSGWTPPDWLAEFVFSERAAPNGRGIGLVVRVGDTIRNDESVAVAFGTSERTETIAAAFIELRGGLRFVCAWDRDLSDLGTIRVGDDVYVAADDILQPFRRWVVGDPERVGVAIDFDRSGKWKSRENKNVTALRTKVPGAS